MATDADFHKDNCNGWSSLDQIESENESSPAESVSEIRDHGSVSFGRFAAESLSWERRSVFSHNRCQEELESFKEPGFVAQKKAYFEEYYGRIRAMKASQAQQQETAGLGRFQNAKSYARQVETSNDSDSPREEMKSAAARQVPTLESDASTKFDSSLEGVVEKQEAATKELLSDWSSNNDKDSTTDATIESSCATELDNLSMKETSSLQAPFTRKTGNSHTTNKTKAQGTIVSARERTKMGNRSSRDGVNSSEKRKTSPHNKITAKAESSIGLGKNSTHKAANGNNSIHVSSQRQPTEACSGSTVRRTSLARNKLVTSSPSGRISQKKNSSGRDLGDKFGRSPPGHIRSTGCYSNDTVPGGLEQKGTHNRLKNLDAPRSCDDGIHRKQKEGEGKTNDTSGGGSKSAATTPTSSLKNLKLVQKNTISQPKTLAHAPKEARLKMPSWR